MRRRVLAIVLLAAACQRSPTAPTDIPIPDYDRADWQLGSTQTATARTRGRKCSSKSL